MTARDTLNTVESVLEPNSSHEKHLTVQRVHDTKMLQGVHVERLHGSKVDQSTCQR